jgi:hypothetical protein
MAFAVSSTSGLARKVDDGLLRQGQAIIVEAVPDSGHYRPCREGCNSGCSVAPTDEARVIASYNGAVRQDGTTRR